MIQASNLDVSLGGTPILHGLNFDVTSSKLVGLVGPNGSGKTTLLRAISGLVPFRGRLLFLGRPVSSWRPRDLARELAFVRQAVSLSFDFTVSELVLLGRSPHRNWIGDYSSDDRDRMRSALRRVDLEEFGHRSALSLSGGELQRVFLAQALVQEADVLLLDEPTAHLDVHYQFEFMDLVREIVSNGRTVVAVFHDLQLAARYADEIIVLHNGRIVSSGSPVEVLTEELVAQVFRMDARITPDATGGLHIQYHAPIERLRSNG